MSSGPGAERAAVREQRRIELRTTLQKYRPQEPQSAMPPLQQDAPAPPTLKVDPPPASGKHLSPSELAEMREQLRQQQQNQRWSTPDSRR